MNDPWFAGFSDGEASFTIFRSGSAQRGRKPAWRPSFSLSLRDDDMPILRSLQEQFGGTISVGMKGKNPNPIATWAVSSRADLLRLIAYFDEHPLRTKKARDYHLWREAVMLYTQNSAPSVYAEMTIIRDALMSGRAYRQETENG